MLCSLCNKITLYFGYGDADAEIRRYANLYELRSLAERCDFCALLHDEAQKLEDPNEGQYCKQSWGTDFFRLLLGLSPILASHRSYAGEHNVFISCYLDARNTPGYIGGPIALSWRSMLGGIYVGPESNFAIYVAGRPFKSDIPEKERIRLGKTQYDECRLNHDLCRNTHDEIFMPKRVLDLDPDVASNDVAKLLLCHPGFKEPYATLSYCWGGAQDFRLTQKTLHGFTSSGIALSDLPATIRDACKLCIGIGIRYLWVCSLCIMQDSEIDWTQQSSAMAAIYNCSDLTISAASSKNCEVGMLGSRLHTPTMFATVAGQAPGRHRGICYVRARLVAAEFREPTELRGWTLQEKLLSRRLLVLGTAQMSWQCAKSYWNQSGTVRIPLPGMQYIFPCPLLDYPIGLYDKTPRTSHLELESVLHIWQRLVQNYCSRKLSFSKDKLPAISGLARWLLNGHLKNDFYLAGIWGSQLPRCLLWYNHLVFPATADQASRPLLYRAPSWTWASLNSAHLEWLETSSESITSTVLGHELLYKSSDQLGEVTSGYLDIKGPLKQGWLVPNALYPESFDFWDNAWDTGVADLRSSYENDSLGHIYLDVYDMEDVSLAGQVNRRERSRACECLRVTTKAGLLLCHTENRQYVRFGLVVFKERGTAWWQQASQELIRLV